MVFAAYRQSARVRKSTHAVTFAFVVCGVLLQRNSRIYPVSKHGAIILQHAYKGPLQCKYTETSLYSSTHADRTTTPIGNQRSSVDFIH